MCKFKLKCIKEGKRAAKAIEKRKKKMKMKSRMRKSMRLNEKICYEKL